MRGSWGCLPADLKHDGGVTFLLASPRPSRAAFAPFLALLVLLLVVAAGVRAPLAAAATATPAPAPLDPAVIAISGGISDNYKARWNADPSQPEHRTWMSMDSISAGGTTWTPAAPATGSTTAATLDLTAADGRTGTLTVAVLRGSFGLTVLRVDAPTADAPTVRWGVLTVVNDPAALAAQSGLLQLTLTSGGVQVASGVVEYRHEPAFDGVPSTHLEYNGPRGRWFVGGTALRTDWEPVAYSTTNPATNPNLRPRIVKIAMALRTTSRVVPFKVTGRGVGPKITSIRFRVGIASYSRWMRVAPTYRLTLPARNALWTVRVQLRDAHGAVSAPVARKVRCVCGG